VRPRTRQTLPVVWRRREVRSLLALVEHLTARMCLRVSYACGLRLTEGTQLQVSDIDAPRMLGRVHQGQGGKDRHVPPAPWVLELLREYWQRQRPRPWVFPARDGSVRLSPTSRHKTCTAVVRQRGSPQRPHAIPCGTPMRPICWNGGCRGGSFRHGWATGARGPPPAPRL
jgi:integrase/recombinase XerD